MYTTTLMLTSHMLCVALAYHLLTTVVDWSKFTKIHAENLGRLRLLVVLLSMALGFLASHLLLDLLSLGRSLAQAFL
ncbi:putative integral membrane protein (TIGR02327 family) [Streptococcus rupicaprae]|uniref:Integral membrane protein (TIGR02327 family) n=1 Tax=Streptococcus rupicaprae TaxID=759619 RepID=A0ABV2FHY3_9STRE